MTSVKNLLNASGSSTNERRPAVLDISNLLCRSPPSSAEQVSFTSKTTVSDPRIMPSRVTIPTERTCHYRRTAPAFKTVIGSKKRRRATATQLEVLNRVFEQTLFPSTQLRSDLGKQLGMTPRTVQIWFQNRRQALRIRDRQPALPFR